MPLKKKSIELISFSQNNRIMDYYDHMWLGGHCRNLKESLDES